METTGFTTRAEGSGRRRFAVDVENELPVHDGGDGHRSRGDWIAAGDEHGPCQQVAGG